MPTPSQIDFDADTDYYGVLGVPPNASAEEIKRRYRDLAKANHPDSTGGDKQKESRFKDASSAYDVLGDAGRRALYDEMRAGIRSRAQSGRGGSYDGPGPSEVDLGELFGQFFGEKFGERMRDSVAGRRGSRTSRPGKASRSRGDGQSGQGGADQGRDPQRVRASDDTWLRVVGGDVASDVRISVDRAILGATVTVATIDGKAQVKIPPGTSSGRQLRLRGKGPPSLAGESSDHYVTVHIDVPVDLSDEDRRALIAIAERARSRT